MQLHISRVTTKDAATHISNICPICNKEECISVPTENFKLWQDGTLIQDAFPFLNECQREFLITGMCEECRIEFDKTEYDMGDEYET